MCVGAANAKDLSLYGRSGGRAGRGWGVDTDVVGGVSELDGQFLNFVFIYTQTAHRHDAWWCDEGHVFLCRFGGKIVQCFAELNI